MTLVRHTLILNTIRLACIRFQFQTPAIYCGWCMKSHRALRGLPPDSNTLGYNRA